MVGGVRSVAGGISRGSKFLPDKLSKGGTASLLIDEEVSPDKKTSDVAGLSDTADVAGLSDTADVTGLSDTADVTGLSDTADVTGLSDTADMAGLSDTADMAGLSDTAEMAGLSDTAEMAGLPSVILLTCFDSSSSSDRLTGGGVSAFLFEPNNFETPDEIPDQKPPDSFLSVVSPDSVGD
jgi:hypothetical protein